MHLGIPSSDLSGRHSSFHGHRPRSSKERERQQSQAIVESNQPPNRTSDNILLVDQLFASSFRGRASSCVVPVVYVPISFRLA